MPCRWDILEVIDLDADTIISLPSLENPDSLTHSRYNFKVSMKQLLIASPRAKCVLQGPFLETVPHADGFRRWKFDLIFDPEAFKIVMNIIHAHFKKVPDKVSLEMLSNITVIVDDLDCRDSVHHFAKLWAKELDKSWDEELHKHFSSDDKDDKKFSFDCARWVFISWLFGFEERFKQAVNDAITFSHDLSSSFGLPIPLSVLGKYT